MQYRPNENRYDKMVYRKCGQSGLKLPAISLGLWHNFGEDFPHQSKREICQTAFDAGITHFDLANNYGPPAGSAETAFGEILRTDFSGLRDELIISSKAGYDMWPGPYGEWGSRKYLIASCDQSLKRMGLDYVDIFYSHRFDPETPLEETMGALDHIVRSGRALYVGISSYNSQRTKEAVAILNDLGTPCLIHQPSYNMLNRWVEADGLFYWRNDQRLKAASMIKFSKDHLHSFLAAINGRVTLVQAINSAFTPSPEQSAAFDWIPHMEIVRIPGSHHLHLEGQAEQVAEKLQPLFS